ncbi:hypothetical protein PLESTB_000495900 [Pleodorina starrii]|uniref:PUA domain-containing protein n=1 Tax=Pleodorina starrii TaxID=330485 RepID=A0A9W6BFX0_9CHLO|nr:hypothetical protein PLESTM_000367300 [Pleodorina starrii]GLC51379.1 hypothetical protein PLESTB_000495900 [Pleodorina starrii]GLC63744.1 hypothetical protein PLESTF_000069400 [Pleodorina starrii]
MALFKKFSKEDVSNLSQVKSSVARGIRAAICETYPYLEQTDVIETLIPKKESVYLGKCGHVQLCVMNGTILFFQERDGPWLPTLRVLHQYPDMMKRLRTDKGAIKFVLSGANIMCPGLTHPDATIHDEGDVGAPVAIYAFDKENAMAVGVLKMSTADIRAINKGIGVDNMHHLNDGLWKMPSLN